MLSRATFAGRILVNGLRGKLTSGQCQQIARKSHGWTYRTGTIDHSWGTRFGAQAVGGFMWWWVLWHLWHEYEHIIGEFEYPDTSAWTNAELGIPPDDE